MSKRHDKIVQHLTCSLADRGILAESGLKTVMMHFKGDTFTREDLETSFKAGAQHIFGAVMVMLQEGDEPTSTDMRRMELLNAEIDRWGIELTARFK